MKLQSLNDSNARSQSRSTYDIRTYDTVSSIRYKKPKKK